MIHTTTSNRPVSKLSKRRKTVGIIGLGLFLILFGVRAAWIGVVHTGPGLLTFGGDEPGTDGAIGTEEFQDEVPEDEYKQRFYFYAVALLCSWGDNVLERH